MSKTWKMFITFVECALAYLIVCALGYGTIKVFNNAEITTLVIGVIGGLLSFAINFIDEKLKK